MTVDVQNSVITRSIPDPELTDDEMNFLQDTWLPDIERTTDLEQHLADILYSIIGPF